MNTQNTFVRADSGAVRAGVISLLVPLVLFLWNHTLDLPRLWLLIISVAVCFVLMVQSVIDLLVVAFILGARLSGFVIGRLVRAFRHFAQSHNTTV